MATNEEMEVKARVEGMSPPDKEIRIQLELTDSILNNEWSALEGERHSFTSDQYATKIDQFITKVDKHKQLYNILSDKYPNIEDLKEKVTAMDKARKYFLSRKKDATPIPSEEWEEKQGVKIVGGSNRRRRKYTKKRKNTKKRKSSKKKRRVSKKKKKTRRRRR
jgi:hypothetical protein